MVRLVKFLVLSYLFPIGLKFGSTLFLNPSSQPGTSPLNEKLLIFEKLLVQRLVLQHLVQLFLVQHCLVQPVWCSVGNLGQKLKETVAGHLTSPCLDLTRQSSHSLSYCSVFFIEDLCLPIPTCQNEKYTRWPPRPSSLHLINSSMFDCSVKAPLRRGFSFSCVSPVLSFGLTIFLSQHILYVSPNYFSCGENWAK